MIPPISLERTSKTVVRAEIECTGKGWEWWVLLRSDAHHDNALCNRKAEKAHLDEAKDRGAGIIDVGDLFCAMQGKGDPRSDRSQLREEHCRNGYFDALVDEAAAFYAPYCLNWLHLSPGNHEHSVLDRHGTNLTDRLADGMRVRSGSPRGPMVGTYQGWLSLRFTWGVRHSQTYRIRYTHGYGGGGPVTKDTIQAQRQLAFTENCDFLLSGHTHDGWYMIQPREYVDDYGISRIRNVAIIKIPGYKDEFSHGNGYAVMKGHPPKPSGSWWVRFFCHSDRINYQVIKTEDC